MHLPIGPLINCGATLVGALLGTFGGRYLPERIRLTMPVIFGLVSICLGIPMLFKMTASLPVVLAVIFGTVLGLFFKLEEKVETIAYKARKPLEKLMGPQEDIESIGTFMEQFIGVLVLFSASGMGIFGAMNEGMTGDYSVLVTKAVLDFFTAIIFATSLGGILVLAVIPQAVVLFSLFFLSGLILPLTNEVMIANFSAVGGIVMIAAGLRISGIRDFPIVNMLPALLLIMPFVAWFG